MMLNVETQWSAWLLSVTVLIRRERMRKGSSRIADVLPRKRLTRSNKTSLQREPPERQLQPRLMRKRSANGPLNAMHGSMSKK